MTAKSSTRRFSRKPAATEGSDSTKTSGLKNVCCTREKPGVLMMVIQAAAASTSVLTRLMSTDFMP